MQRSISPDEQVVEGEYVGLKGVQESIATFSLEGEKRNRQDVTFHGIQIHPSTDTDLSQWLEALQPENPQMVRTSDPNFASVEYNFCRINGSVDSTFPLSLTPIVRC